MYREPHLQRKSDECADLWFSWKELWDRDSNSKEAKEARQKWSNCVTEFGKMVSQEVKTNPRYTSIRKT
jgi:hypothetical protein